MKQLFSAITTLYKTSNSFRTSLGARFDLYEAQERSVFPYGVFFMVDDTNDYTFNTKFDNVLIQFSIFSDERSVEAISDIYDNLTALYDDANLSVTGYSFVRMVRENSNLMYDLDPNKNRVWHYAVTYNVMLETT